MASSSASSTRKSFKHHVFISFRGEDTRKRFVDHLYAALTRRGIHVYKDDCTLPRGEQIGDSLMKAIEESKLFLIVHSKYYASSSWCLEELEKIMECQKNMEQTAYPIFYDVDPADVRKQSGVVGKAFARHNNNGRVHKWKQAMTESGNLVGWDLRNRHEAEAIDQIV